MIQESKLLQALVQAEQEGNEQEVDILSKAIAEQRTQWSKANGLSNNKVVNTYGLEEAEKQRLELGGEYNPAEGMSGERTFATAMGRGFNDIGQGVKQILMSYAEKKGFLDEGATDKYTASKTQELANYQKLADESPLIAGAGRLIGNAAATPIPAGAGASALGRIGTTAIGSAAAAGSEFVPEGGSRLQNAALGGLMGGGVQGIVGEPLRKVANKAINTKAGNLNLSDEMSDAVKFADSNDLPLYYDDIKMDGVAQKIGQQIDEIPVIGGAKTRQAQNEAAKEAAQDLVSKFAPDTQLDDLHTEVSKSAQRQLTRVKDIAAKKYTKAHSELNAAGQFDMPEVRQQIGQVIEKELASGSMADKKLISELQKVMDAPSGNFEQWAGVRSKVLGTIRDAKKGQNANIGSRAVSSLEQVSQALNEGLDDVAAKIGGSGGSKWKKANEFYKNTVVDYKRGPLAKAINNENPEQILNLMIGRGGGKGTDSKYIAEKLFKGLDRKGKDTVKYGMLEKSYSEAMQESGVFSPARFASNLEKFSTRTGVLFGKEDKAYIDGLTKYMRLAQNSGDFAANIKTGQKAVGTAYALAAGAGSMINPSGTATGAISAIAIKKLFRTTRGRSFLLALSKTTPDSKQAADLITKMNAYVSRGAALASAQPETQ